MKKSLLCAATIIWLVAARVAIAQPSNPSFETGDFTGWLVAGTSAASVVGATAAVRRTAFSSPAQQRLRLGQFEYVDGLLRAPGSALDNGNGSVTEGSAIRQTFSAAPAPSSPSIGTTSLARPRRRRSTTLRSPSSTARCASWRIRTFSRSYSRQPSSQRRRAFTASA
jgi:hypothetical protein